MDNFKVSDLLSGSTAELIPNVSRRTLLICSHGYYLRVFDEKVDGTTDINDKNIILEMQSVAIGEITIQGEQSKKYIMMDNKGNITTTSSLSQECVFKERHLPCAYNSYESKANTGWYLGITKYGTMKKGFKTAPDQTAVKFLTGDVKGMET